MLPFWSLGAHRAGEHPSVRTARGGRAPGAAGVGSRVRRAGDRYPPGPSDALSLLIGRPEGVDPADRIVLGGRECGRFWERLGFRPTGETRPWRDDRIESLGRLFERPLPI